MFFREAANTHPGKDEKLFSSRYSEKINIIKFVAISSVIWGHCLSGLQGKVYYTLELQLIQSIFIEIGRIGTILFFLISGIVISDKITQLSWLGFIKYRLNSLIIPWLLFLCLLVLIQMLAGGTFTLLAQQQFVPFFQVTGAFFKGAIFHAAYWFVPVTIVSTIILILSKKYIQQFSFGLILAGITLFYGINLYFAWIPTNHTKAFIGYTFFLWLGMQIRKHLGAITVFLDKVSWLILLTCFTILFGIACMEGMILTSIGCEDAYASIRITNVLLSILVFLAFLKSNRWQRVKYLKPQNYSFGIYLIHSLIIIGLAPIVADLITKYDLQSQITYLELTQVLFFSGVLILYYIIVALIKRSRYRFILGGRAGK